MKRRGEGLTSLVAILALLSTPALARAQESSSDPGWSASIGVITIPGHDIYSGRVNTTPGAGARYREKTDLSVGVQGQAFLSSDMLGDISLSAYGTKARSTGFYSGLGQEESLTRDLLTLGLDMGWEPPLWESPQGAFRIPFGPSIAWQRLDLSSGHRDQYADPTGLGAPPDVDWSDRTWISLGGYGGFRLTLNLSKHLGFAVDTTGRFLFSDTKAWAGQEEDDIRESTGNAVNLGYEDLVIFLWTARAGLLWRP